MKIQLTIIGLGQIGSSFGLALGEQEKLVKRVGFDIVPATASRARKIGAVDETVTYLSKAVNKSDVIVMAIPVDQVREMMEIVTSEMKPGAVLMDTAPIKAKIADWVAELLPQECEYVGLTPAIAPQYLLSDEIGIDAAHPDMFQDGLIAISTPPGTDSSAIKLAADLVRLVGASPLFADLMEMDGLMTATHAVPQIIGAALLNATVDQPGWREARKMAGRAYAEVTGPIVHFGDPGSLTSIALLNRENILRVLDGVIASLQILREDINREDAEMLTERLERAQKGRERWWKERQEGDWAAEGRPKIEKSSAASSIFGDMLRFGGKPRGDDER
ncbi:MAG: prephenate dehydrogenase [Anaerolineales bacterium]|nr:prephenate dehydrogenase [Anaerolineales bacterium]